LERAQCRLRFGYTISLRDDRPAAKQTASEARNKQRRSERAVCLAAGLSREARYPIYT